MKLTPRDRGLLAVIVVVLLCGGFYKLLLVPEHHRAAHLDTQIAAAQTALGKAEQQESEGHAAEVALRSDRGDWSTVQRAIPEVANVPALLKLLSRTAASAHVSMQSISLSSGTATQTPTGASTGETAIPVSLTFNGGYQALNRLVSRLDSLVRISHRHLRGSGPFVGISSVAVNPVTGEDSSSELSVQLTASIYQRASASAGQGNTEGSG